MGQHITLITHKSNKDEIESLLDKSNIPYGNIEMYSTSVEVVKLAIYGIPWAAIATVICGYMKMKSARTVEIFDEEGRPVIKTSGESVINTLKIQKEYKQLNIYLRDDE